MVLQGNHLGVLTKVQCLRKFSYHVDLPFSDLKQSRYQRRRPSLVAAIALQNLPLKIENKFLHF
jgi:hypothetical protein